MHYGHIYLCQLMQFVCNIPDTNEAAETDTSLGENIAANDVQHDEKSHINCIYSTVHQNDCKYCSCLENFLMWFSTISFRFFFKGLWFRLTIALPHMK